MKVAIVDYGMGNLHSVHKALAHLGADAGVTEDPRAMAGAERLVVPGVGAFGDCMNNLVDRGLAEPVRAFAATGKPVLGICVGLQIFFGSSAESPGVPGLGLLEGTVEKFEGPAFGAAGGLKVPHMGWNRLKLENAHPLLAGLDGTHVYFVHSYYPHPRSDADALATCSYGLTFAAAAGRGNVAGTQFHPEKSQDAGLRILKNFLGWRP